MAVDSRLNSILKTSIAFAFTFSSVWSFGQGSRGELVRHPLLLAVIILNPEPLTFIYQGIGDDVFDMWDPVEVAALNGKAVVDIRVGVKHCAALTAKVKCWVLWRVACDV